MFGLFAPRCPIGPRERVWVERGIGRLVDVLGLEWVRGTPVLTLDDLQDVLSVEPIAASAVAERLAPQFPFPVEGIDWLEEPDIAGQIVAGYVGGDPPTGVVPHQPSQTPELRTALVARCLAEHAAGDATGVRSRGTPHADGSRPAERVGRRRIVSGQLDYSREVATSQRVDSWFHQRQAFMPSRQFGYAMAVRCFLCGESSPPWSSELRLDAREPFEQGLKFLRKRRPVSWDASRDALRSFP